MKHIFMHEDYDGNLSVEINSNAEVATDLVEAFGRYLLACGFHPDTVDEALGKGEDICS